MFSIFYEYTRRLDVCESTNEVALNARQHECLQDVYEQLKDGSSIMSQHPSVNTTGATFDGVFVSLINGIVNVFFYPISEDETNCKKN